KDVENAEAAYEDISGEAGGRTLDTSIFSSMQQLSGKLAEGKAWAVSSIYSGLTQAVVAREYPRDNIDGLKQSIDAMKSQLKTYQSSASSESRSVEAQTPGYFVKSTEGRQTVCTVDEMYALTPEKLSSLVSKADETENDQNMIGYIVDSFEWYFACCVSSDDGKVFESMKNFDISFPYISAEKISADVQKVMYFDNTAIVIFRCGYMNEGFLGEVSDTVDIIKKSYTGIKIPKEAIHLQEDKWGVYCLTGAIVKFKPVDWIYQSDAYFVAKQAESSSKGLYLYDKIIISGKDLEENKVIK
ncbi:MAG: HlyD family efflux transporter periplasmic adaptor subunit, partial [Clostridiaceae bacterium]|nr:HlyD family efflux transporter periplasmic adaptor subunit [Clostridiaceae bacterium]